MVDLTPALETAKAEIVYERRTPATQPQACKVAGETDNNEPIIVGMGQVRKIGARWFRWHADMMWQLQRAYNG